MSTERGQDHCNRSLTSSTRHNNPLIIQRRFQNTPLSPTIPPSTKSLQEIEMSETVCCDIPSSARPSPAGWLYGSRSEILIDYFQISTFFSFHLFTTDGCHVTKSGSNFILSDYPTKIISRHCQAIFPKKITKCVIQDDLIVAKQLWVAVAPAFCTLSASRLWPLGRVLFSLSRLLHLNFFGSKTNCRAMPADIRSFFTPKGGQQAAGKPKPASTPTTASVCSLFYFLFTCYRFHRLITIAIIEESLGEKA